MNDIVPFVAFRLLQRRYDHCPFLKFKSVPNHHAVNNTKREREREEGKRNVSQLDEVQILTVRFFCFPIFRFPQTDHITQNTTTSPRRKRPKKQTQRVAVGKGECTGTERLEFIQDHHSERNRVLLTVKIAHFLSIVDDKVPSLPFVRPTPFLFGQMKQISAKHDASKNDKFQLRYPLQTPVFVLRIKRISLFALDDFEFVLTVTV